MADPATGFASDARAVRSATGLREGEFLHVYRGTVEGVDGAVRLLTPAPGQSDAVLRAFDRRADAWERCRDHPNVVTVHARGETPRPWLATDGLDTPTLLDNQPEVHELTSIVADATEALQTAHRTGITHGALTPESVLVVQSPDGLQGRVDDWGLERACRLAGGDVSASPYTAPELLASFDEPARRTDEMETAEDAAITPTDRTIPQTDVYGLGAVTYYGVTGRPPVVADDEVDVSVGDGTPTYVADLPAQFDEVLGRALAADPAERYESVYEFKLALLFEALGSLDSDGTTRGSETATAPESPDTNPESDDESDSEDGDGGNGTVLASRRAALGALGLGALGAGGLAASRLRDDGNPGEESSPVETGPPEASFVDEFLDGTLSIHHTGGDSISAGVLVVSGTGFAEMPRLSWSDDDAFDEETPVLAGDSLAFEADEEYDVSLLWEGTEAGETETLATFQREPFPRDITGDADPPEATFTLEAEGDAVRVTHHEGEHVTAGFLFVRGEGFPGSPERRVRDLPGLTTETTLVPGESFTLDEVSSGAAIRIVWESPTAYIGLRRPGESVVLGSYVGPDRPLDATVGTFPTVHYDSRNTGYVPGTSSKSESIAERWRFETGERALSPVVADGIVYVFVGSRGVFAVDAQDGVELWRFAHHYPRPGGITVTDGTAYIGTGDPLYAVDAATGEPQWSFTAPGGVIAPPTVEAGRIYVWSGADTVYALDRHTGRQEWTFDTIEGGFWRPALAVTEEVVSASAPDGRLYALDAASGTEQWHVELSTPGTEPTVVDDTIYLGTRELVSALDAHDGSEKWRFEVSMAEEVKEALPDVLVPSPALVDETVYVGGPDGTVYALAAETGEPHWQFETDSPVLTAPTVADDTVYVGCLEDYVYAISTDSGTQRWRHETGSRNHSSPVPLDGTTFLSSIDYLYALEASE